MKHETTYFLFFRLFCLIIAVVEVSSFTANGCTENKCTNNDDGAGYSCKVDDEGKERICLDDYEGRSYDNFGPILIYFNCCPTNVNVSNFSTNSSNIQSNFNSCDPSKCTDSNGNCIAVTPDYGRIYYGSILSEAMTCAEGYEVVQVKKMFVYTCCPPGYIGPIPMRAVRPPSINANKVISGTIAAIAFITTFASATFIISILCSNQTRCGPFNLYLVVLIIPDMLLNIIVTMVSVAMSRSSGFDTKHERPPLIFKVRYWLYFFYWVSNFWVNAIIAFEIHCILKCSSRRVKRDPPSTRKVLTQSGFAYLVAILISTWYVIGAPWSPYTLDLAKFEGFHGSPLHAESRDPGVFSRDASLAILFVTICIPVSYVVYVHVHTWWCRLLPKSGRTRVLALYFNRIIFVFFTCYIPGVILWELFLTSYGPIAVRGGLNYWLTYVALILVPIQNSTTIILAMFKPDIYSAFNDILANRRITLRRFSTINRMSIRGLAAINRLSMRKTPSHTLTDNRSVQNNDVEDPVPNTKSNFDNNTDLDSNYPNFFTEWGQEDSYPNDYSASSYECSIINHINTFMKAIYGDNQYTIGEQPDIELTSPQRRESNEEEKEEEIIIFQPSHPGSQSNIKNESKVEIMEAERSDSSSSKMDFLDRFCETELFSMPFETD